MRTSFKDHSKMIMYTKLANFVTHIVINPASKVVFNSVANTIEFYIIFVQN